VHVTATSGAGAVRVVIADRGPGIDSRFLAHAFEPFTQLDASMTRTASGLGVGLFVARRLAEYLGCQLELVPRPGGGTQAIVTLRGAGEDNGHVPALSLGSSGR
jgi:two-component system osmolarity sensor histidine kinase EnvZ